MKKLLLTSCLALGLTSGLFADAIVAFGAIGGSADGATRINFDANDLGAAAQAADGVISFSHTGSAQVVEGSVTDAYAAPYISGSNGTGFGNTPGMQDTSRYLSTGIGSITFAFAAQQNYFGLLWGSVDSYNQLDFYLGGVAGTWLGSLTGAQVTALATGDQGVNGTLYVNIYDNSGFFDTVVASSSNYAFEIDNIAYGVLSVPDSGATVALLGLSFACLIFFRRKAA